MAITSQCQACGATLSVADEHAGRQARCPKCGQTYTVPQAGGEAEVSAAASRPDAIDRWSMLGVDGRVYGPVDRPTLDRWVAEGRVSTECQLRQGDQPWQPAADYYPDLVAASPPNPFAAGGRSDAATPTPRSGLGRPHRGGLILALAIIGLVTGCVIPSAMAWIMGGGDLKKMERGEMDREGYGLTQAGKIIGQVMTIIFLVVIGLIGLWLVFMLLSFAAFAM